VQSPQPLETNWDLEAELPELGEFLQIFQKKRIIFKHILIHIFA